MYDLSFVKLLLLVLILVKMNSASLKKHHQQHHQQQQQHQQQNEPISNNNNNINWLEKIFAENINSNTLNQQNNDLKRIFLFIDKVAHIGVKNTCESGLIQSEVQAKMRKLKSIISTCNGYCRLAINQDGQIYGGKEFNLDTIWNRVDITNEQLATNTKALIGAYYIKFVLADKYLCITKNGELYSSSSQSKACLWFNDWPKLISATYNLNLVIHKNCKINVLNTNNDNENLHISHNNNKILHKKFYSTDDVCKNNLNITSGFSPELQKFFRNCQNSLINTNNNNYNYLPSTKQQAHNKIDSFNNNNQFKTILMHTNPIRPTTTPINNLIFSTKNSLITKKTFNDKTTNHPLDAKSALIEKAKLLCKDYLMDEMVYKRITSNNNNYEYLYDANLNSNSNQNPSIRTNNLYLNNIISNTNNIPKLCIDYIIYLNQTTNTNKQKQKEFINYSKTDPTEYNYDESSLFDGLPVNKMPNHNNINSNKYKKCFSFRNTPLYKQCMDKHYKCYRFNNDIEKLKKCRKKHGITLPRKKQSNFYK